MGQRGERRVQEENFALCPGVHVSQCLCDFLNQDDSNNQKTEIFPAQASFLPLLSVSAIWDGILVFYGVIFH